MPTVSFIQVPISLLLTPPKYHEMLEISTPQGVVVGQNPHPLTWSTHIDLEPTYFVSRMHSHQHFDLGITGHQRALKGIRGYLINSILFIISFIIVIC